MWKDVLFSRKNPARWIALVYILFGILWILFSDQAILLFVSDPAQLTQLQTYKGWFFVLGSGFLIYTLMERAMKDMHTIETSLKEKDIMQKDFLERYLQPLWQTDSDGRCIFSNSRWVEFTGFPLSDEKVFPWIDIVHDDDKPVCITKFSEGLISKKSFSFEYRILDRYGDYRWVINSCIPNFTGQGEFSGVTSFLFDINDKKILDERYRESSRRYGYLFMNNPHPMMVCDMQDFRIIEVNKASLHQYGYTESEFLTLTLLELLPTTEVSRFLRYLSEEQADYEITSGWIQLRKDGSQFNAELTTHSLPAHDHRETRLVIVYDITEQVRAFNAVKEGEHRFRMIFEQALDGGIIFSDKLKILDINPSGCNMLGLGYEAALRLTPFQFITADSREIFNQAIQKLEKGELTSGLANLVHSSGKEFRCEWYGVSFNESGNARYFFSFRDVDEKYKIQNELIESQRMNSTLISGLPGMAYRCLFDPSWTMLFVSKGVYKLTGYEVEEIVGNKKLAYNDLIHPDDSEHVVNTINDHIKRKEPYEIVYRIISRDSITKWAWEQGEGVYDEMGELKYIEGFIIDITREKETAQQVEFQSYFLSLIIDNIPFPLFYKGIDGTYTGCNKSFAEYLDMSKDDIIGRTAFEIFGKEPASIFQAKDQELYQSGRSQSYETDITFPGGNKLNVVFHKSVFYDPENKPLGILGVYFDITERVKAEQIIKRQLEEMSRINSELERFSYTVSHDLRSPLVTIKGFLGLLKEDIEDQDHEQIRDDLKRIDDATDKMHQLLEGILELSRLGRVVQTFEKVSLSLVAGEAKELLYGVLKDKNYKISIQHDMPVVTGDKSLLREVFQNLIENAIKFTKDCPHPKIQVFVREAENGPIICIKDNGIGISPLYHKKIFGLFNKLSSDTQGTGIGLSLVKRIVETHNGKIWVESDGDNKGAVFCFTLNTEKSIH